MSHMSNNSLRTPLLLAAFGAAVLVAFQRAPSAAPAAALQNPGAERCGQIMKMLVGEGGASEGLGRMRRSDRAWVYEGGQIGRIQEQLRGAEAQLRANPSDRGLANQVTQLRAEQNRIAGLINRFTDQLTELKCPDAPPPVKDLPAVAGGGDPATPPPPPPGGGKDSGEKTEIGFLKSIVDSRDPNDWKGDWTTDVGTLTLKFNMDRAGTLAFLRQKNAWGPALPCSDDAVVYGGEVTFTNAPPHFTGIVMACANHGTLEGKYDNSSLISPEEANASILKQGMIGRRVGYFRFYLAGTAAKPAGFAGNFRRWSWQMLVPLEGGAFGIITGRK